MHLNPSREHLLKADYGTAAYDDRGFSTAGMVLALLIALSLVFSSAQVYQVNSASAAIQHVADVAALAAENAVAEFYIVARTCDAIVLSLSLTGVAALGLGIVSLCVPATAALSDKLIKAGTDIIKARNSFAEKAAGGLNTLQRMLPFISAAKAEAVIASNSGGLLDRAYIGIAVLLPFEGEEISVGRLEAADGLIEDIEANREELGDAAEAAEEAAHEAKQLKERAFQHDCGSNPGYCMFERADHLSGLPEHDNPLFHSADTWSFSVALERAQAYYPQRLSKEAPTDQSVEGRADSQLRRRFYEYAAQELAQGYVIEDGGGGFQAYFPLLPKNTEEMRGTALYTEAIYPITENSPGQQIMHAWEGCPHASSGLPVGSGSMAQMDGGGFLTCPQCGFSVSSFGKIAAATSSIETGFEYHYRIVAESAAAYTKAQETYAPRAEKVRGLTGTLLDSAKDALSQAVSYRIEVAPPGRVGAISLVVNTRETPASQNFFSGFVENKATLGAQAAMSASTLVGDDSDEEATVISSLLDGIGKDSGGLGISIADGVLGLWSSLLSAYAKGQEALSEGIEKALDGIPLASESGLGAWAAGALSESVEAVGLQPVELASLKPVSVNSAHVLDADDSGFATNLLSVKLEYLALEGQGSGSLFSTAVSQLESYALDSVEGLGDGIVIASVELIEGMGPNIPITIALPPSVKAAAQGFVQDVAEALRGLEASMTGVRRWE